MKNAIVYHLSFFLLLILKFSFSFGSNQHFSSQDIKETSIHTISSSQAFCAPFTKALSDKSVFRINIADIHGKKIKSAKVVIYNGERKQIRTYRTTGDFAVVDVILEEQEFIWVKVSKWGYLPQTFKVNLSQAGWQTTVILGSKHSHYYATIDAGFPSGRIYPFDDLKGLVLVMGNSDQQDQVKGLQVYGTNLLSSYLPADTYEARFGEMTIDQYNDNAFMQHHRSRLATYTAPNWAQWRKSGQQLKFYPAIEVKPYGFSAFSNFAAGRLMPGKSADSARKIIQDTGFTISSDIDPESGMLSISGDPSWGIEMVDRLKILISSGMFLEMYPEIKRVMCANPPDGC